MLIIILCLELTKKEKEGPEVIPFKGPPTAYLIQILYTYTYTCTYKGKKQEGQ